MTRRAAVTSEEKSTCPGESIRLIKNSLPEIKSKIKCRGSEERRYALTLSLLLDGTDIVLVYLEVHGDGGGLDRDTALLFVVTSIRETHVARLCGSNDTSFRDEGVGEGGLAMVDCDFTSEDNITGGSIRNVPWAITLMLRMLVGLSMRARIWST